MNGSPVIGVPPDSKLGVTVAQLLNYYCKLLRSSIDRDATWRQVKAYAGKCKVFAKDVMHKLTAVSSC